MGGGFQHPDLICASQILAIFGGELVTILAPERFDAASAQGAIRVETGGEAREIPVLASYPLAVMRSRPQAKALWWGRWLTLEWEDIERASEFFQKHGQWAVFFLRFFPVMRTMISLPAGRTFGDMKKCFRFVIGGSR